MNQNLEKIIIQARDGDEEAFTQLYKHYYKSAFRYAYKLTNNRTDAEDVVQESFVMIHEKLPNLKFPYAFSRWMARIILSNSVRFFKAHPEVLLDDDAILHLHKIEKNIDFLPKEAFRKGLDLEVVNNMINCMRPKQSEVLNMVYIQQRSFKEVADLLNIPEGTVKSRSVQAKMILKKMVNDYLTTNEPLAFREALASGTILSIILSKVKQFGGVLSSNAISVSTISACVICGITASASTFEVLKQKENSPQTHNKLVQLNDNTMVDFDFPNSFERQVYQDKEVITSKNAYFTLMNWANTKAKLEEKEINQFLEVQPIIKALKDSNSEYYRLLELNGWYKDFNDVKKIKEINKK